MVSADTLRVGILGDDRGVPHDAVPGGPKANHRTYDRVSLLAELRRGPQVLCFREQVGPCSWNIVPITVGSLMVFSPNQIARVVAISRY